MAGRLKLIGLAIAISWMGVVPGRSADLAVAPVFKAPPMPAWNWSGFYAGFNAGYSFGDAPYNVHVVTGIPAFPDSIVTPRGPILGGQLGYNWQVNHLVLGLEADGQWSGETNSACTSACTENTPREIGAFTTVAALEWFSTLRGRIGWADGQNLFYLTAGPGFGGIQQTVSQVTETVAIASAETYRVAAGWSAGVGIETRLGGNWTAKIEYLHLDLGGSSSVANYPLRCNGTGGCVPALSVSINAGDFHDEIFRAGVNYKFGAPQLAPVAAITPLPASPVRWDGFYAGLNGGYGFSSSNFDQIYLFPASLVDDFFNYSNANLTARGALLGGQAGYDWQLQHFVLGLEADIDWSNQESLSCSVQCGNGGLTPTSLDRKFNWIATTRARVGIQNDGYLFYLTGGAAFAGVTDVTTLGSQAIQYSDFHSGWAAGGGLEARLWGNWRGKIEYLYLDFGTATHTQLGSAFGYNIAVVDSTGVTDQMVRIGLNYQFGN